MTIKERIINLGRAKTVIAIAVISTLLSLTLTLLLTLILGRFGIKMHIGGSMLISTIVPLFVAPAVTWYVVDLLIRINQLEGTMRELASYDSLTGLSNRRAFLEHINHLFSNAKRHEQIFSIIMADMDHFKKVNDQYGHDAGDKVLVSFSKLLVSITRESDLIGRISEEGEENTLIGRMGGEEFVIFLPNTSQNQAWKFSERLHNAARKDRVQWRDLTIQYRISMGLVSYTSQQQPKILPNCLFRQTRHSMSQKQVAEIRLPFSQIKTKNNLLRWGTYKSICPKNQHSIDKIKP